MALALTLAFGTGPEWLGPQPAAGAPRRIVSLAPSLTEILFALGVGPRVVAVTRFDHEPAAVNSLPRVGGFVDPDPEAVLATRPDLVVAAPVAGSRGRLDALARLQVSVLVIPAETLDELWQAIEILGRVCGVERPAAALRERMQAELAAVAAATTRTAPLRVLLVVGYRPLIIAGAASFLGGVLSLVNARNALASAQPFAQIDLEAVWAAAPDVIVDLTMGESAPEGFWRPVLENSKAPPRLLTIKDEALLRPGPRLGSGLRGLAAALRPAGTP